MLTRFEGGDYSGKLRLRTGESEAVFRAYSALRDDHPELFWLGGRCAFTPQTGDMRCAVLYTPDQIGRIRYQLRRCLFQLVRGTAGLPPVEREILVYERHRPPPDLYQQRRRARSQHRRAGAAVGGGVRGVQTPCSCLPCAASASRASRSTAWVRAAAGHCWSVVWLEGEPVHCDVTWDKPSRGAVRFAYLNRSDCQIARDHGDFRRPGIPVCRSERWNYDTLALSG